jgi:hypothetical protein
MSTESDVWSRIKKVAPGVPGLTKYNLDKMQQRGSVPAKWHHQLVTTAPEYGVEITYEELNETTKH